jgi:hypothetical protein
VRAEERSENGGRGTGAGGTGISWKGLGFPEAALMSERVSVEEGIVEEELSRADEAALLYGAFVEIDLSVQVLLLKPQVSTRSQFMNLVHTACPDLPSRWGRAARYRLYFQLLVMLPHAHQPRRLIS